MARKPRFEFSEYKELLNSFLKYLKEPPEDESFNHHKMQIMIDEPYGEAIQLEFKRLGIECELLPKEKGRGDRAMNVTNPYWPPS